MRHFFSIIAFFCCLDTSSQDVCYARKVVDTLSSANFWGRGYTNDGMKKAAQFLADELAKQGVQPMDGKNYLQPFTYPVNSFPGDMKLSVNDRDLEPGKDFIVSPDSRGVEVKGKLQQTDDGFVNAEHRVFLQLVDKLTWSVATEVADYTVLLVDRKAINETPRSFKVEIENKFLPNFKAYNVCGVVKGTRQPDSLVIITAHYDHLGGMGEDTFFPGANDNASGVALLLNLAKHFAANPQPYSIGFILFAGEEAGLIGSKYFTEQPPIPLKNIRFLLNTDLAGTGDEGITVVNATQYPNEFKIMQQVNEEKKLLAAVNSRGKAANSDHYYFSEKGVPAFFFYTLGGIKAYHDVFDKAETLPLTEHEDLFKLVVAFVELLVK